jgi:outer membrane translocation and assembly module TamA
LKRIRLNKKTHSSGEFVFLLILTVLIYSCNPTKYVPEGETLLDNNHISVDKDGIKKVDLAPYIRQKPNKKIFGARFHLGLYNLSNIDKEKWPHSWLRNIGEEPVIYDPNSTTKSRDQIKSYIASKGYFDSKVTDSTKIINRKSEVYYSVHLKAPYTIRNLYYEFADSTIRKLFNFDSVNCLIERGKPYDVDLLQAERTRFERFIKDRGFYGFSTDHIFFRVDSAIGNRQVNIYYGIKNFMSLDNYGRPVYVPHSTYRIKNIYIYPDFVPKDVLEKGDAYFQSLDTLNYKDYFFISPNKKPDLKYDQILHSLYLRPGSVYNVTNTEQTQNHLMSLKTFRLVNIFFKEHNPVGEEENRELFLDCFIQLTLLDKQSYKVELEGTNTTGDFGGALNLVYQHKNLFHGAELFNLKLKGAYEALSQSDTTRKLRSTQEYGIETSLRFPKFLLPVLKAERFIKKYNPTTTIVAAYNYQKMPFYTRTMANASFGYNWNAGNYKTHIVNPLQLNLVNLLRIDENFRKKLDTTSYLAYSYKDVMILGGNYSFIFNNQKIQKSKDYWFLRLNAEVSGNLLSAISNIADLKKKDGSYIVLGQPFAQYFRADLDLRYNVILNDVSSMVYRGFLGLGIPYGNSKAIPFEKQYFGGGANGIRAWQVRSLGPGSYRHEESGFINQTADIKLEANAEYRFKLFWILEGALFVDAGNIWTYNEDESRPGSKFVFKYLLDDIAVGSGTGLRFDFKFVIGRLDMGVKLRDPSIHDGSKWIMMSRDYNFRDDFTFVLGIGYPF